MKKTKGFLLFFGTLTLTVGIGLGSYYLINTNNIKLIEKTEQKRITLEKNEENPVTIYEYTNLENELNGEPTYFLGIEGLKILSETIKKKLQFGPEIEFLKAIHLNRKEFNSENVLGSYYPDTQEMFINLEFYTNKQNHYLFNKTNEEKVSLFFPTLYHEYLHHVENVNLSNLSQNTPEFSVSNIKTFRPTSGVNNISKNLTSRFLDEWLQISRLNSREKLKLNNNNLFSNIFSEYSNFELFAHSNFSSPLLGSEGKNFIYGNNFLVDAEKIGYLYSFSELFVRKFMSISYLPYFNSNKNSTIQWYGRKNDLNSFVNELLKNRSFNPLSDDASIEWENSNLLSIDDLYGGRAITKQFNDKTKEINFTSNVLNFLSLYQNIYGTKSYISQLHYKDNSILIDKTKLRSDRNFDEIKITGYVDKENLKAILYDNDFNESNNTLEEYKKFNKIEVAKNNYKYSSLQAKSNPFNEIWDVEGIKGNKNGYVTKDYININNIKDRELLFWFDENDNNSIEYGEVVSMAKNDPIYNYRPISSYREVSSIEQRKQNKSHYLSKESRKIQSF